MSSHLVSRRRWSAVIVLFLALQAFGLPVPGSSSSSLLEAAGLSAAPRVDRNTVINQPRSQIQERARRKVANLDVTAGPVEYMKQLRSSLTNEDGSPTMARDDDPTSIWGLVDKDIAQDTFRAKPSGAKCLTVNQFVFGWKSLVESYQTEPQPLQKAILRTYLEVIPRFVQNGPVDVDITIKAQLLESNEADASVMEKTERITVDIDSNSWKEFDITENVKQFWPPSPSDADREIEVTIELRVDCKRNKKVPASFISPATIPLSQSKRRERHAPLQPLLLVYLSDEEIKRIVRDELRLVESAGDDNSTEPRIARSAEANSACAIEDFPINFNSLHLSYIIFPYTYNARRCSGSCSHSTISLPSNDHLATNHAKLMASARIISEIKPEVHFSSPPENPCCVPTKYRPYALLVNTAEGGTEYIVYPSMVVDACGCR